MANIKLLALGDGAVGKTCLLISYATKSFPRPNCPTTFDSRKWDIVVNYRHWYKVALWDTAGGEDYDRLRPLCYPDTDIVLLCFALDNNDSFENIKTRWVPELNHFIPNTPMIMVGCKSDLRVTRPGKCISRDRIDAMSRDLKLDYYETSALKLEGLAECFENAVLHAVTGINARRQQKAKKLFKRKEKYKPVPVLLPPAEKAPVIEIQKSTFADDWLKMLVDLKFANVTFLLEDKQQELKAHKVVLCSASEVFRQMLTLASEVQDKHANKDNKRLTENDLILEGIESITAVYLTENDDKVIITNVEISSNIKAKTFARVLEFLYTGDPKLSTPDDELEIQELQRVANIFKLKSLETICRNTEKNEECFNPEIATNFNVKVGKQMKSVFFNQASTADVVFCVEDQKIYANKVVLYARCSVMAAMFGGNFVESSSGSLTEVKIPNATVKCFVALLEYLYTDRNPVEDDYVGLLVLADEYGLSRLVNLCELSITNEVDRCLADKNNKTGIDIINLLQTAQIYNATQLSSWCLHHISVNYTDFEKRPEFKQLKENDKDFVEKHRWPPLSYLEEVEIYEAEMKEWEKQQCSIM